MLFLSNFCVFFSNILWFFKFFNPGTALIKQIVNDNMWLYKVTILIISALFNSFKLLIGIHLHKLLIVRSDVFYIFYFILLYRDIYNIHIEIYWHELLYWSKLLAPFPSVFYQLFALSVISFYGLVLWGCGLTLN